MILGRECEAREAPLEAERRLLESWSGRPRFTARHLRLASARG